MAELRRVVRYALRSWWGHPEYEDLYSEGLLQAWRVLTRSEAARAAWTTIAVKAARYQALEYLRSRRSGLLDWRRGTEPERPIPLSSLIGYDGEPADADELDALLPTEGGIDAADARLQWDLVRGRLTKRQRRALFLVVGQEMSLEKAAEQLGCSHFTVAAAVREGIHASREALGLPVAALPPPANRRLPPRACGACFQCGLPLPPTERTGRHMGRAPLYCSPRCRARALEARRRADQQGGPRQERYCRVCRQLIPADRRRDAVFCSPRCKNRDQDSRRGSWRKNVAP